MASFQYGHIHKIRLSIPTENSNIAVFVGKTASNGIKNLLGERNKLKR